MKRKCSGCRAVDTDGHHLYCSLGYETEDYHISRFLVGIKPKEECPKPTTYADLFAAERKLIEDGIKRSAN